MNYSGRSKKKKAIVEWFCWWHPEDRRG